VEDLLSRFFGNLADRLHGPLTFRLLMQPTMAAVLAIRAGVRDARSGRPPYGWAIVSDAGGRRHLLREGWRAIAGVFTVAILVDVAYQLLVLQWVYPLETVTVAFVLAFVPYLLVRGPANRIASRLVHKKDSVERDTP
jgi:hypothetical protein